MSILKAIETDKTVAPRVIPSDTQQVCIDLPGEAVRCVIHKAKLEVVLRKHRDVIFDIQMFKGMTYTVSAEQGQFFDTQTSKLVSKGASITFADGQTAHIWVGREFKGDLVLKSNGKVLGRYTPNALDTTRYGADPNIKPAPLLVTLHAAQTPKLSSTTATAKQLATQCTPTNQSGAMQAYALQPYLQPQDWTDPLQLMMPTAMEAQAAHVVEVISKNDAPPAIISFFMNGGEAISLDSNDVITRNWIISQLAGTQAYLIDNRAWAKELMGIQFRLERVKLQDGKIGHYIIFKGNPRLRRLMSGTRYSLEHTKIVKITAGAGSAKQTWETAKGAAKDSVKVFAREEGKLVFKGGGVAVLFTIGMSTAEWYKDYSQAGHDGKPKKDFVDLLAKIGIDLTKAGLSAAIATAAVALVLTGIFAVASVAALPAIGIGAVVVGTLLIAIAVGYGLDVVDKKIGSALGENDTASWISKKMRALTSTLQKSFSTEAYYHDYESMFAPSGHTFGWGGA